MDKIKDMIKKKMYMDMNPQVWEITENAPVKIPGIRIFQSSFYPEADPMPYNQWILFNGILYDGNRMIYILKKNKIFPKSEQEAFKLADLIVYSRGDSKEHEAKIKKKDGYYEIKIILLEKPMKVIKINLTIKLGENIYEAIEEKVYPV
jgi:hypothetical protein